MLRPLPGLAPRLLVLAVLAGCGGRVSSVTPDAAAADGGAPDSTDGGDGYVADAQVDTRDGGLEWPNAASFANSDPWLRDHHDELEVMRPRLLVLNFVNAKENEAVLPLVDSIIAALRESSRPRGYRDASAPAFLQLEIAKTVDLRDHPAPAGWKLRNSTLYPRRPDPAGFEWAFDYAKLFGRDFADRYAIPDPASPGKNLDLCGLVETGRIHEVWVVADADVPDAGAAEVLEWMPRYAKDGTRLGGSGDRCAGNGCFDLDVPNCGRSLRIGFVNHTRGPGCFLESLGHGMESMSTRGSVKYLQPYFREFAGFDLDARYGTPFPSWYACEAMDCLIFPTETSVLYSTPAGTGKIDPYVPVCGNAHFTPNGRHHYDLENPAVVQSTCEGYRRHEGDAGRDLARPFSNATFAAYRKLAPDCMGPWLVWWRQNWPGPRNGLLDDDGRPMKNWWPYLFY